MLPIVVALEFTEVSKRLTEVRDLHVCNMYSFAPHTLSWKEVLLPSIYTCSILESLLRVFSPLIRMKVV